MEIPNKNNPKVPAAGKPKEAAKTPTPAAPVKVAPMFRKYDWLTFGLTFLIVWVVYLWTLAPELTLEDSGELCTGSYYAGIPHPPGYPFWAIYSWFWTWILPIGNVAWRVEVGQSFAAAMGCGMVALMVSRGSSMLIEGIEELKGVTRTWETAICTVSGFVSGLLLGFDGYMWGESVVINRISVFGVPWLIAVILCLMRWAYAPQQRRYLYLGMFLYGICATIHQTLLLSAIGVEVLVVMAQPRLGRSFVLTNSALYACISILKYALQIPALQSMAPVETDVFNVVGVASILAYIWLATITKIGPQELLRDAAWFGIFLFPVLAAASWGGFAMLLFVASLAAFIKLAWDTRKVDAGWLVIAICGIAWSLGVSFYFYEALSGMTDPPMQWGYPRTVEGFFHALSRGQYSAPSSSPFFEGFGRMGFQLWYIVQGLADSFSWVFIFIGLLPFFFIHRMHWRERGWIIGLTTIYLFLAVLLVRLLDVTPDRSAADLNEVFFTASHALFAIMIGYGITLLAAYMATHYEKVRRWCFVGGGVATFLAIYCLVKAVGKLYFGQAGQMEISWLPFHDWEGWGYLAFGPDGQFGFSELFHWVAQAFAPDQYGLPVYANLILIALPVLFIITLAVYRQRGPVVILLAIFLMAPVYSGLTHWYASEQRNHWFGYWFGHDMFTPPFTDTNGQMSYDNDRRAQLLKDPAKAPLIYPEMARDTILFGGTDPGRFCPTYIIFCESFIPHYCQPKQDQKFDRRDVYIITQNALADGTYLDYLRAQYNRSKQIDPPFFSRLFRYAAALAGVGKGSVSTDGGDLGSGDSGSAVVESICSLLGYTLDVPATRWGAYVERYRRARGVYPPKEIYIPSPDDSQTCFQSYEEDVARRQQLGQLKPGEDVNVENGRVQVSGQVAVMEINGLLCKVIFDQNPTNEFYVEESFPLDWMYDYETPFGIIMKINRKPVYEFSDDLFQRDHAFWSKYSERLCGNWITYDTSVKEIADFVDRTYIQHNYKGYTGDRAFVRDEDAQKAFSKLRSSQAGMYAWRCAPNCPPEYRQKSAASQEALRRETDFAFKQAFAFCPYSPEAVFRYINFLLQYGRFEDALTVATTCQKLDPFNDQISNTVAQLKSYQKQNAERTQAMGEVDTMENIARTNPGNIPNLIRLGGTYLVMTQTNRGVEVLNEAINSSNITYPDATIAAQYFGQLGDIPAFQHALERMVVLAPDQPDPRFHLAEVMAVTGHPTEALQNLQMAITLSRKQSGGNTIAAQAMSDPNLNSLHSLPDFQKIVAGN
jgi:thioredoxin-like negative regulator of GroEL